MTERTFIVTEINYCLSLPQLQKYSDDDLCQLFMYASRDKEDNFRADCTYWMCVMEVNRRKYDKWPYEMDIISYVNIYDESQDVIFRYGNQYQMYVISGTVLVYDDDWIPHIFGSTEDDSRCIWKYFCVSREDGSASESVMS